MTLNILYSSSYHKLGLNSKGVQNKFTRMVIHSLLEKLSRCFGLGSLTHISVQMKGTEMRLSILLHRCWLIDRVPPANCLLLQIPTSTVSSASISHGYFLSRGVIQHGNWPFGRTCKYRPNCPKKNLMHPWVASLDWWD